MCLVKPNAAFQHENLIPAAKHGGGSFPAMKPGQLPPFGEAMNYGLYQEIL